MIRSSNTKRGLIWWLEKGACLIMVALVFLQVVIVVYAYTAKPLKSDCIIILGCKVRGQTPSPYLLARVDEGLRLYQEGLAPYIIVSGGKGRGEDISEARWMKDYLVARGVNPSVIITDDRSFSTRENMSYSAWFMQNWGFDNAIIVSNKFHLMRAAYIAEKLGIKTSCSGITLPNEQDFAAEVWRYMREVPAMVQVYWNYGL